VRGKTVSSDTTVGDTLIGTEAVIVGLLTEVAVIVTVVFAEMFAGAVYVIVATVWKFDVPVTEVWPLIAPKLTGVEVQVTPLLDSS